MTAKPSRPLYYAASLLTLLVHIRPRSLVSAAATVLGQRHARLLELRRPNTRFMVRGPMDIWTVKEVCLDRDYERVGTPIQNGWRIIDVGAGIGEFAVDVAVRHPACVVHAFEPMPEAFDLLCQNLRLNHVRNVRAQRVAVTGASGGSVVDVAPADTGFGPAVRAEPAGAGSDGARTTTLTGALNALDTGTCDFLKIDCEGCEYDLLLNVDADTLARIARICLEYHDGPLGTHDQLVTHLTAAGFRTRLTGNKAWHELGFLYAWRG
ncbi:MAG: FkbM family methyltransferase [Vicinamibacterales bacterium]